MGISSPVGTPDHQVNKRTSKKALKVLGVDPSQNKVAKKLGLDLKSAETAIISSSPSSSAAVSKRNSSEGEDEEEEKRYLFNSVQSDVQKTRLNQIMHDMPKGGELPHSEVPELNEGKSSPESNNGILIKSLSMNNLNDELTMPPLKIDVEALSMKYPFYGKSVEQLTMSGKSNLL